MAYRQGYAQDQYPQQPYQQQSFQQQQQGYGQATYAATPQYDQQVAAASPSFQAQPTDPSMQSDFGSFQGGSYTIAHRDTSAVLNIELQQGVNVRSRSGAMIHMSGSMQLAGKTKFSMKKLFTSGEMSESTYTGPGRVALTPTLFGDIFALHVDGSQNWIIGKDAFLACTSDVHRENKSQGFSKAMFSGEDLFVYRVIGQGLMWLTSFGAVDRLNLQAGEQQIVDDGHLVAWSCDYKIERAGGGTMRSMKTGERLVCRFIGPGTVYVQTRNMSDFEDLIRAVAASGSR